MMPPRKRLYSLSDVHLYCVTTTPKQGSSYEEMVEAAVAGGADAVQLRDKALSPRELIELAKKLKAICDQTGALFILNDRVDVALAAGVDGVHLGQDDVPIAVARRMLGHARLIGCSTHGMAQAVRALSDGADYVSCGPVFATPTKPDYPAVGLELVRRYAQAVKGPFVAIGGIDAANAAEVVAAGADRVAVVRAVCGAEDIQAAARSLKETIMKAKADRAARLAHFTV